MKISRSCSCTITWGSFLHSEKKDFRELQSLSMYILYYAFWICILAKVQRYFQFFYSQRNIFSFHFLRDVNLGRHFWKFDTFRILIQFKKKVHYVSPELVVVGYLITVPLGIFHFFTWTQCVSREANRGVLSVICQNDRGKNLLFSGKMDCDDKEDYQILDDQSSYLLSIPIRNS